MKLLLATVTLGVFSQSALGITAELINNVSGTAKCLDVRGDILANGTPVQMFVF